MKQLSHKGQPFSPNAEEAFSLLSRSLPVSKEGIEEVAKQFLALGVGHEGSGWIVIRSGALGAFVESRETQGVWVDAFWTPTDEHKVVDVTGQQILFDGYFLSEF